MTADAARQSDGELIDSFLDAMASAGVPTNDTIVADHKLHRCHIEGDKIGSKNGWYVLHLDGLPAGSFGSWKAQVVDKWCSISPSKMTAAERQRYTDLMLSQQRERELEQERIHVAAALRATTTWEQAEDAAAGHPYLVSKAVQAHGVRRKNALLYIPVRDADGKLWSLQSIDAAGTKDFLLGGRKRGCSHHIRRPEDLLGYCIRVGLIERVRRRSRGEAVRPVHDTCGRPRWKKGIPI